MYNVSELYLDAMHEAVQEGHLTGTIGGVAFNSADVLQGSACLTNACADSSDICVGSVFGAQLNITFCNKSLLSRGEWLGKEIVLQWSQRLPGLVEYYEDIPVGRYTVAEVLHSAEGVVVTAYDNMSKFDKKMSVTSFGGSVAEMLNLACSHCRVTLGMTTEEIDDMAGTESLPLYPENDVQTWRDVVYWLAQLCGGFATIDRSGALVIRQFTQTEVMTFDSSERFAGAEFADYRTFYTSVNITNTVEGIVEHHKNAGITDDGLAMNLGANPFLQDSYAVRHQHCAWIVNAISSFDYVPFRATLLGNPAFDLGDVIEFTEGTAGTSSKCCICAMTLNFGHSGELEGFGANPSLQGAQSKTDKNISGLASSSRQNQMIYGYYENVSEVEVGLENSEHIGRLYINATEETTVEVQTKVTFDETLYKSVLASPTFSRSTYELVYKLDNVEVARIPFGDTHVATDLHTEDTHTIEDYLMLSDVEAGSRQTLDVYLEYNAASLSDGVTLTGQALDIPVGAVKITLRGQGLAGNADWIGVLTFTDDLHLYPVNGLGVETLASFGLVSLVDNLDKTLADGIPLIPSEDGQEQATITEELHIYLGANYVPFITEAGEYIYTEDNNRLIVTGT